MSKILTPNGLQNLSPQPGTFPGVKNALYAAGVDPVDHACALESVIDAIMPGVTKATSKPWEKPENNNRTAAKGLRAPAAKRAVTPVPESNDELVNALAGLFNANRF